MKRLLLPLLFIAALSAAGCAGAIVVADPYPPAVPGYVYAYPDGCWADDAWYSPCPWHLGPRYGYYAYYGGYYYFQPHYVWQYRPHYPPPRVWRDHRHYRYDHRYHAPSRPAHPRGRDHRRH